MYVSHDDLEVSDPDAVVVPATAKALFAALDIANQAVVHAEAMRLEMVRRLCVAFGSVDEDAFGETAERLVHHG